MVCSGSSTFWRQNLHSSGQTSISHWENTHKAPVQVYLPHSCSFHLNSSWITVAGGLLFWSLLLSETWMTKLQDHQGWARRPRRWAKQNFPYLPYLIHIYIWHIYIHMKGIYICMVLFTLLSTLCIMVYRYLSWFFPPPTVLYHHLSHWAW